MSWFFSRFFVLGASVALMLQTNYRFFGPLGAGEFLMLAYLFWSIISTSSAGRIFIHKPDWFSLFYIVIVAVVVTPLTLLSMATGVAGSSLRDLLAYLLVTVVLLGLPSSADDVRVMVIAFLIVLFLSVGVQFILGGDGAYYFSRFSGGAKNPNQLALYLVSAVVLSSFLEGNAGRFIVFVVASFFGYVSYSDAFVVFFLVVAVGGFSLIVFPARVFVYFLPLVVGALLVAMSLSGSLDFLLSQWAVADEGGARAKLYLAAISAWLDSPFSMIFGYGAGSFSGFDGPFGGAEAHNTMLDLATIGGVFGIVLFPFIPLWIVLKLVAKGYRFAPVVFMGLIAFSFFHFVGRQPVFWISLILIGRYLYMKTELTLNENPSFSLFKGVNS